MSVEIVSSPNCDDSKTLKCVEKALAMPIVRSAKDQVDYLYVTVRSINIFSRFGFGVAETSFGIFVRVMVTPITGRLQLPISLADKMACLVLDEVATKFPVLSEPTEKVIESGRVNVLGSNLSRKTLSGVDAVLGIAEAFVTLVPVMSINTENQSFISMALTPAKYCYVTITYPIRLTACFIQTNRSRIQIITRNGESTNEERACTRIQQRRKISPSKQADRKIKSFADCIFFVPRYLLQTVGRATCDRSRLTQQQYLVENITEEDGLADDKKRKYSRISPDDSEDEVARRQRNESYVDDDTFLTEEEEEVEVECVIDGKDGAVGDKPSQSNNQSEQSDLHGSTDYTSEDRFSNVSSPSDEYRSSDSTLCDESNRQDFDDECRSLELREGALSRALTVCSCGGDPCCCFSNEPPPAYESVINGDEGDLQV